MNSKAKELAIHDKDTGSSEIQIALLTEKIEALSKRLKIPVIELLRLHSKMEDSPSSLRYPIGAPSLLMVINIGFQLIRRRQQGKEN